MPKKNNCSPNDGIAQTKNLIASVGIGLHNFWSELRKVYHIMYAQQLYILYASSFEFRLKPCRELLNSLLFVTYNLAMFNYRHSNLLLSISVGREYCSTYNRWQ